MPIGMVSVEETYYVCIPSIIRQLIRFLGFPEPLPEPLLRFSIFISPTRPLVFERKGFPWKEEESRA